MPLPGEIPLRSAGELRIDPRYQRDGEPLRVRVGHLSDSGRFYSGAVELGPEGAAELVEVLQRYLDKMQARDMQKIAGKPTSALASITSPNRRFGAPTE